MASIKFSNWHQFINFYCLDWYTGSGQGRNPDDVAPAGTMPHSDGMGSVLTGTSGFSYEDWRGVFYPDDLPREEFLRYYSLIFPFVELDYTYYRMPDAAGLARMVERTRSGFLFAVKAHRSLTHEVTDGWRKNALAFSRALEPLSSAGRLAAVVLQFPFRFHHENENRIYLRDLTDELAAFPCCVEFRNSGWLTERVFDGMRERHLGFVMTDEPSLPGLLGRDPVVTADLAYLRFHGRNADQWWSGEGKGRYDYLYSDGELAEWVEKLRGVRDRAARVLVAFNNCPAGQAARNARTFAGMVAAS